MKVCVIYCPSNPYCSENTGIHVSHESKQLAVQRNIHSVFTIIKMKAVPNELAHIA